MQTILHTYYFDTRNDAERLAYNALKGSLEAQGLECFETWGNGSHYLGDDYLLGIGIELETEHLFNNQWNTAPFGKYEKGLRVFDWAQDYPINFDGRIKKGHYLLQTDEMSTIRRNTSACGYCGEQEPSAKGYVFCPHCLGSQYLNEEQIHLTRMQPIDCESERAPLTDAEKAFIMPLYVEAQTREGKSRDISARKATYARIEKKYNKAKKAAENEYRGFMWLLDHNVNIDNCIYYNHTDKFCFGWRNTLSETVRSALRDLLAEFPYEYELK
jgi:hypothetical protein